MKTQAEPFLTVFFCCSSVAPAYTYASRPPFSSLLFSSPSRPGPPPGLEQHDMTACDFESYESSLCFCFALATRRTKDVFFLGAK